MPHSRPAPDLAGFADAQQAKIAALGSDITFLTEPVNTWPAGTQINPDTGDPYDPTIEPESVVQEQFVIRCAIAFRAFTRAGGANESVASAAGWSERTRVVVIAPYSMRATLHRAVEFIFHEDRFKIDTTKDDEVVGGYRRVLIYGAAE